jgi:hypothetical protein
VGHVLGRSCDCILVALLVGLLFPASTRTQRLSVPIVVQPAEWQNMATPAPTGTRTNAPITFGIGIPDSAAVDCPSAPGSVESEPTLLELQTNSGSRLASQFRCLARWPSGNAEWVLVDAQLPSFSEGSPGYDTSLHLARVTSGGGNFPETEIARQCTGKDAPTAGCPDSNHIIITTGAATFLIKQRHYNLFDDVQVGSQHIVSVSNHGSTDGLALLGPPHAQYQLHSKDSVSCSPGPIPSNYSGPTICGTVYDSNLDPNSTCSIEENGPLRSAIMCQGDMVNSNGDIYMHWRTRMHFWANRSDAKVTVALRNADVTAGNAANYNNAFKEFAQFEARLTDNLTSSSRNFQIANDHASPASGVLNVSNGSDTAYLYQAYSQNGEWSQWRNANNCQGEHDGCVVSPIPRTGLPGHWTYAENGYQIQHNGGILQSGENDNYPVGWADIDDGSNGIEVGVYQLSMYWPKSLEFRPGTPGHCELRIGIWPDQREFAGATSAVSYAAGWPQYAIHDTYWNFHVGTLASEAAQNDFLYFQQYLLARPADGTYYNSVKSAAGFDALFYDIPDPIAEDTYYRQLGVCSKASGQCLGDVGSADFPYRSQSPDSMKIFRFFLWQAGGGTDGTQFEQRYSFLRNWLQRGGVGTSGSQPGRYVWAAHWYRMIVEKSLPRSDTPVTSGPAAGFRSLCKNLAQCEELQFAPWGDPMNNSLPGVWNGGMRNWGDAANAMEHSVYWGIFTYYFLSGDEWVKEQLLQGFKDRYQNPFVPYNNLYANVDSNLAPGHGHINSIRAVGHWFSGAARMMRFLQSIGDPDADNSSTVKTSPGSSPGMATVAQGVEQNIAASIALPYISSGYPKGWREATEGDNCHNMGTTVAKQLCSEGVSPVRAFPRSAGGSEACGKPGGVPPCDSLNHRAAESFQIGIWAEGLYDVWLAFRELLGPNWHEKIGGASGGPGVYDGQMGPYDVVISEKALLDAQYAAWQQMDEENCVTTGSYATSGCVYDQFSDYLNSPPGCTSSGDCLHSCVTGCQGLTQWFALAAAASTTNSTLDVSGKSWQFLFESQLRRPGAIRMELGSHMMQFAINYILEDGSTRTNGYLVVSAQPVLREIPITVTPNPCIGPKGGNGTCMISWRAPANLTTLNGETYRLKYWLCPSPNSEYGVDCPTGGKTIVPTLKFHSNTLGAGFPATDGSGSWEIDPSRNWNWASTTSVPDCLAGETAPLCNPDVPSGSTYIFHTQPSVTYTFSLFGYLSAAAPNSRE